MRYHMEQRGSRQLGERGFTLAELLVVMLILGSLMAILMPIVSVVREKMQNAKSRTRIATIDRAVETYKLVHRTFYPGQEDINAWEPQMDVSPLPAGTYTGSQILAAHLLGYYEAGASDPYHKIAQSNPEPSSTQYMNWEPGMLMDRGSDADGRNCLADAFATPMPVAYYPSGGGVGTAQFRFYQNSIFTGSTINIFEKHIADDSYGGSEEMPYRNNEFLLIAPGVDREYFNEDDVHNWAG